ncbi:hypothetical protein GALL_243350 [mine drainage metagenome]|uniref:Uncharacterized protein n=1 Tax=mine drainage metagenome TaxID=410659 RepID=A0A1J5RP60_9ZZZZ
MSNRLLTAAEAAAYLQKKLPAGLSAPSLLSELRRTDRRHPNTLPPPFIKHGGKVFYSRHDLDELAFRVQEARQRPSEAPAPVKPEPARPEMAVSTLRNGVIILAAAENTFIRLDATSARKLAERLMVEAVNSDRRKGAAA